MSGLVTPGSTYYPRGWEKRREKSRDRFSCNGPSPPVDSAHSQRLMRLALSTRYKLGTCLSRLAMQRSKPVSQPQHEWLQRTTPRVLSISVLAKAAGFGRATTSVAKDLQAPKNLPIVTKLEWSRPLQILKYPDPRLRAKNAKVGVFDESLKELANDMIRVMYEDDGVGLAAPQVGVNVRLMVFNPHGREKPGNETILANPEIVSLSGPRLGMEEGCLSFPKMYGPIERSRDLLVQAQNEKGEPIKLQLGGDTEEAMWIARIFLHEYDHLQGILFPDRMSKDVLESVRSALVDMEQLYLNSNPGATIQRISQLKESKGFGSK